MAPEYWRRFVNSNDIIGSNFEINEDVDLSTVGADLRITYI